MKKILVTGANGFTGSFLCEEGLKRGYSIFAGVRKNADLSFLPEGVQKLEMDYSSGDTLLQSFRPHSGTPHIFDDVIHTAGIKWTMNADEFYRYNYELTRNIVNVLADNQMVNGKFIYISSLASHGPADFNEMKPVTEYHTPHPVSPYGKSKLLTENYIRNESALPYLIFRPTAIYGPRDRDFLPYFRFLKYHVSPVIGSKKNLLSFIYIKDFCRLIFDAIESPIVNKGYFVSDGNTYTQERFIEELKMISGKRTISLTIPKGLANGLAGFMEFAGRFFNFVPKLNRGKMPELTAQSWDCDICPLIRDFHYIPQYNLNAGLKETWDWYKAMGWI